MPCGQQALRYTALNAVLTSVGAPKLAEPLVKCGTEPARPHDVPQALSKGILLAFAATAGQVNQRRLAGSEAEAS